MFKIPERFRNPKLILLLDDVRFLYENNVFNVPVKKRMFSSEQHFLFAC